MQQWLIEKDFKNNTTLVKLGLQEIELPFLFEETDLLDQHKRAETIIKIFQAGFKTGYEAKEFNDKDKLLSAMLGENY